MTLDKFKRQNKGFLMNFWWFRSA